MFAVKSHMQSEAWEARVARLVAAPPRQAVADRAMLQVTVEHGPDVVATFGLGFGMGYVVSLGTHPTSLGWVYGGRVACMDHRMPFAGEFGSSQTALHAVWLQVLTIYQRHSTFFVQVPPLFGWF